VELSTISTIEQSCQILKGNQKLQDEEAAIFLSCIPRNNIRVNASKYRQKV
jgi:hypothetical protein